MKNFKELFKTHTKEKITAVCFLCFLILMAFGLLINIKDVAGGFINTYRTTVPTGAPYLERIEGAIDAAENAVNEGALMREKYVEAYGLAQLAMNKKSVIDYNYGALYKTKHDQITFAVGQRYVDDAVSAAGQLANEVIAEDIDFLYIQLPFKIPPANFLTSPELPVHITDYANANADAFVAAMEASSVDVYDIRDDFWSSGMTQNELFFNTDHHWTIEGAFLGTGLIADYLNENYDFGIDEDLYTYDNFTKTTYEDFFLGSMGRRVGRIYGGLDDFTLITPSFENHITLTEISWGNEVVYEGPFEESVLAMDYITDPDKSANRYAVYHGDYQELRFVNENASSDKKILLIKDSFGLPVYSFLSLGIQEVRALDMRLFTENVADYVAEYQPDLVILMYNADSYVSPMFNFNLDK